MDALSFRRVKSASLNQQMLSGARIMADTIAVLAGMGFTVIGCEAVSPETRPTVIVQDDVVCRDLIASGEAVYYAHHRDSRVGSFRVGQFQFAGCRVIWTELEARAA